MHNFISFLREQGVVGLAIGFILGGAVSGVVASFIKDIVNPILGLVLGQTTGLETLGFNIFSAHIAVGSFVSVLINFVIVAAVVYYGFKMLGLEKLDKKKE